MASDTIDFKSYLQMSLDFFNAPDIIASARKERKICGLTFPFPELIVGGSAVPVFIPRLDRNKRHEVIQAATAVQNAIGMGNVAKGLDFLKRIDSSGSVLNVAGNLINEIVHGLNETYETAVKESAELGFPVDHCYGAKGLFGLYRKLGTHLDMNFSLNVRCSVFFNYHESLTINNYVRNNFIMDMPYTLDSRGIALYVEEIWNFIGHLEKITGKRFDMNRFHDVVSLTNRIKGYLRQIFLEISPGDILPCSPATFSELNSLLVYSQIDCNSRVQRYADNLEALVQEMHDRIDTSSKRFDATGFPKIIYTPMFGGFEPEIAFFADELGARVYYPDWLIYGAMDPVNTSGDIVRNYAEGLLKFQHGFGLSGEEMARNIITTAQHMNVDGIIFCEVFGCRSMCTGHRILRDLLRQRGLDIPLTVITFNNIGDSLGQVKTRVSALVEMIKG
nr:2-hydroxyacyl-CoA dehydratase family protein [Candidatus Sigynarchaeota archaeon]